jgi:predicted transposase YbfD/YdcC
MTHPDWVLKHKASNTEIRCIRGKYYLYNITSLWSNEKKRSQKKTLGQVGVITQEYGLIPTGQSRRGRVPKGQSKLKDQTPLEAGFLDAFDKMEDTRSKRNQLYPADEILLVALLALIGGAEGWQDIYYYGQAKLAFLKRFLPFKNGIPTDDTFRRFFRSLDPEHFRDLFVAWVKSIAGQVKAQVIAIDGKASRRSYDQDGKMLHTVSAFATEARIVLGQEKVSGKSNEITAIPELLQLLDIKNHIITIDAMGCQYQIANQIIEKKADYIFALKGNQSTLAADVKLHFENETLKKDMQSYTQHDKAHGRIEERVCSVLGSIESIKAAHPKWAAIKSIIKIDSTRTVKGKTSQESRYYISSLENPKPETALKAIRSHWAIENTLHWTLDMSFNEDYSRIRRDNAPQIMSILRHIVFNIIQQGKDPKLTVKAIRKLCAWNDDLLIQILLKAQGNSK